MLPKNEKQKNLFYDLLRHSLFAGLQQKWLDEIISISQLIKLEADEYLLHEGDPAEDIYIILEGTLEVLKYIPEHHHDFVFSQLTKGETVGEMAWLDNTPRSASVRSVKESQLLRIPFAGLKELAEKEKKFYQVFLQIFKNLGPRLRSANEVMIQTFIKQLAEYKIRVALGIFTVYAIIVIILYNFITIGIKDFIPILPASTFISIPIGILFLILFYLFLQYSKLSLEIFGITTKNWRVAVIESIIYTVPILVGILVIKMILIHTIVSLKGVNLFQPYHTIHISPDSHFSITALRSITVLIYCLISVPLQELIVRGGFQGSLHIFLTGKHKDLFAVLISNLIYSEQHLFLSFFHAIAVIIPGLYFGWLYSRHQTLIGVIIAHAMIGYFGLFLLGI